MTGIFEHFGNISDPRTKEHKIQHKLIDIIFISIAAVICGAEDWNDIEDYGQAKEGWLRTILELPSGIPSHDTFNRVFSLLDPEAVGRCFTNWVQSVVQISEGQLISIDGKRMCQSGEDGKKGIIHMVSAWSQANNMVLGQLKVNDKSNEITAIPLLLDTLMIKGCWVSIDAMGCQKEIATKIKEKGAEYILAVKDNQPRLHDDVQEAFAHEKARHIQVYSNTIKDHGRIEKRTCRVITRTDWICQEEQWPGLTAIIEVQSERTFLSDGRKEAQTRHYIASGVATAEQYNEKVRGHWGIENNLHWMLDVCFGEDSSTKRNGNAAVNFSFVTKIGLNLLYQSDERKGKTRLSMKRKRKKADRDNDYLLSVLTKAG